MKLLMIGACGALALSGCEDANGISYDSEGAAYFKGNECSDDCSGHIAGYDWAMEEEITDIASCGNASLSFQEGCEAAFEEMFDPYEPS